VVDLTTKLTRRSVLALGAGAASLAAGPPSRAAAQETSALKDFDPIRSELVMNLVVTCSKPERMGASTTSKDGTRDFIWPIIGGRFEGPNIRGTVVPGGADYPVMRPDGIWVIDALYRLRTDDGTIIIIHNRGLAYSEDKYRLVPEFTVTEGKYDWLNKSIFLSTLVTDFPASMRLAKGPDENDRLIQVHRIY
jgi:hypothetical protein